jgi:hypothetical protein
VKTYPEFFFTQVIFVCVDVRRLGFDELGAKNPEQVLR